MSIQKKPMQKIWLNLCLFLAASLISACASQSVKTGEAISQNSKIEELDSAIADSEQELLRIVSTEPFKSAIKKLKEAVEIENNSKTSPDGEAMEIAKNGLAVLKKAEYNLTNLRKEMPDVFENREHAISQWARTYRSQRLQDLDERLADAGEEMLQSNYKEVRRIESSLAKEYAMLARNSFKEFMVKRAEKALNEARNLGADDYAPKTFGKAEKALQAAELAIDAAPKQKAAARQQAQEAESLARQARSIAILAKDMERKDFSYEDQILWHQSQVAELMDPLVISPNLEVRNDQMMSYLKTEISELLSSLDTTRDRLRFEEKSNDILYNRLLAAVNEKERVEMRQKRAKARLKRISGMFSSSEAKVRRSPRGIEINAHGMDFPVGKASVKPSNYDLLDKIVSVVTKYPESTIVVTGHADATGSREFNKELSKVRAKNIAKFIETAASIPPERLRFSGAGEMSPVAPNEASSGRESNRRIDVLIEI